MLRIRKNITSTLVYVLTIGLSFYSGIFIYPLLNNSRSKKLDAASIKEFRPQLELSAKNALDLNIGNQKITIKKDDLKNWIESYVRNYTKKNDVRIAIPRIINYLESIAPQFNIEPVNAKFMFKNNRADIFIPSTMGKRLNTNQSANIIALAMLDNKPSVSLAFNTIEPEITLEKVNDLGIKTMLGRSESDYGKSSLSRIHNIKIGMSKFNGIILKPGEEFSFNGILGEVDERNGYQAELVIKGGQLVREYGGGLCQVATTIFRSAILSGLEIIERRPHSFPVQYYNPQGFDATIYPNVVDLKFVNNTGTHVLIQTRLSGSKVIVEIYGSADEKTVKMEGPFQYDQRANGSMKAYFVRKIYQDDKLIKEERFDSVYKPPPPHERNPLE